MAIHTDRKYKQLLNIRGAPEWVYYNQCPCNEIDSVSRRHVKEVTVDPNHDLYLRLRNNCTSIATSFKRSFIYNKWNFVNVIDNTQQKKQSRYRFAYNNIITGKLNVKRMARGRAFVKFEKMTLAKVEQGAPARLIQFRSYEYTYLLKSYLGPIWKELKESKHIFNNYTGQTFGEAFTSGKTQDEVGKIVCDLFSRKENCVVLCLDHSFFDGHHHEHNLAIEHLFWNLVACNKNLKRLLKFQEVNFMTLVRSMSYYTSKATRLSGDWNTSAGNSIINLLMLTTIFPQAFIVVNGDDSLVFLSKEELDQFSNGFDLSTKIKSDFKIFGQETKVDRICHVIEDIEYCQCSPVWFPTGYRMIRTPKRLFGRVQYTSHVNMDPKTYYTSVGLCELAINKGVPMLQNFSLDLISRGNGYISSAILEERYHKNSDNSLHIEPVHLFTRYSFERAFGISIQEQINFEQQMNTHVQIDNRLANRFDRMSKIAEESNRLLKS